MKLSCVQANLNQGLSTVGRAVATRPTLPITSNVLLATDQSRLKLVATNLEMAISCWIGAKVETEGAITVPARLITDFVNSLPNDNVSFELPDKTKTLQLRCARFEARISGVDAKDFPPIPDVGDGINTKVEIEDLRDGINHVVFAAATEESRPVLTGVDARFEDSQLTLAAADGFRLAVYKLPLASPVKQKAEVIIPARTFTELSRLMTDRKEPVQITINPNRSQILFRLTGVGGGGETVVSKAHVETEVRNMDVTVKYIEDKVQHVEDKVRYVEPKVQDVELVSQLVQGTFPQYSQLIPQSHTTKATVDVAEFQRATRTASIFARDGSGIVRLIVVPGGELSPGKMTISARSEEIGEDIGEIDAVVEGTESKIAFNGKYLSDVLGVLKETQVSLETTNPSSPGIIRPLGNDKYVHVVMPMFVQW